MSTCSRMEPIYQSNDISTQNTKQYCVSFLVRFREFSSNLIFCFPMFLSLEIFIRTLVLLFQFLYLYMICDNYFISEIFKYLRMNVSKLFRKVRPSLSLWNLAQPLTWYFTWTTCVCVPFHYLWPLPSHYSTITLDEKQLKNYFAKLPEIFAK